MFFTDVARVFVRVLCTFCMLVFCVYVLCVRVLCKRLDLFRSSCTDDAELLKVPLLKSTTG